MEHKGWLESGWELSETNRRVKSYRMTAEGRRQLRDEASSWTRFAEAMAMVLNAPHPPERVRQP
jgi:DNA-binding PadR family transcriptional regulator